MEATQLVYDGSFEGFLSAIFLVFERKLTNVTIYPEHNQPPELFATKEIVITETHKADRVWKGLRKKNAGKNVYQLYYAFLSEKRGVENLLLDCIKYIFESETPVFKNYSNPSVLKIAQIAKMVGREKHRMEAFVRFKLTTDGIYFANITPDFNVLPLISKHFERRYADQRWIIYDLERNYGLHYNLEFVEDIQLTLPENFNTSITSTDFFTEEEVAFENLWKDYFNSVNIASRKNKKLHERHVPKRYWKYLSEKQ